MGSWPGWGSGGGGDLPADCRGPPGYLNGSIYHNINFTTCMLDILLMFNVAQVHFLSSTFTLIY